MSQWPLAAIHWIDPKAASILAKIIREDVQPPFTIAVYGRWGSGKTIFLDLLKQALDLKVFHIVLFNAWQYESTGNVTYSLFKRIESDLPPKKQKEFRNTLGKAIFKIGASITEKKLGVDIKNSGILDIFGKSGKRLQNIIDENYNDVKTLKDSFEKCVQEVLVAHNKSKMIFLIDDLDRCNPENVVNMLESLKNFFFTPNCIFIISADRDVVTFGIRQKYHGSEFISGDEYLDKIVNLAFELFLDPKIGLKNLINQYKQIYASLLRDHNVDFLVDAFELTRTSSLRKAKRILDRFVLLNKYLDINKWSLNRNVLFFTIVLQELAPQLYADAKKFSNNKLLDRISLSAKPAMNTQFDKISEYERVTYQYVLDVNSMELILRFKSILFQGPNIASNEISKDVTTSIKFIESLMI